MFGSKVDWINQHSVFPDYFRQRFYETHSLFPDMAWNLGAGQNIYNFSYYGLFSPVILLSYLLPFVPMTDYIMVSSMLGYGVAVVLFYVWISDSRKGYSDCVAFLTSAMFGLAAPMIYQSYNQLMFINYMPFLMLALIGTDAYVEKRRSMLLVLGTLGMILTSFYFSIGGMLALCLYVYGEKVTFRRLAGYAVRLLAAVCMAGILLVPTALVLFSEHRGSVNAALVNTAKSFPYTARFVFSPYGMGLSLTAVFALLYAIVFPEKKKVLGRRHVQAAGLLLVFLLPLVAKLLNGGLYAKDKVFMPFIPVVCLQTARCIRRIKEEEYSGTYRVWQWGILAVCMGYFVYQTAQNADFANYKIYVGLDGLLLVVCVAVYVWRRRFPLPLAAACIVLLVYGAVLQKDASKMITTQEYEAIRIEEKAQIVKEVTEKDDGFYRVDDVEDNSSNLRNINRVLNIRQNLSSVYSSGYNSFYQDFRQNIYKLNQPLRNNMMQAGTDNPFYLQFIGVRYVIGPDNLSGYDQNNKDNKNVCLGQNMEAAPVCYATSKIITRKAYDELNFPDNQTVLMQYAVSEHDTSDSGMKQETMQECGISLPVMKEDDVTIKKVDGGYEIEASKETALKTEVKCASGYAITHDAVFAMQMDVENLIPEQDMHVRVNDQTNRLTSIQHEYANYNEQFHFAVSMVEGQNYVTIKLSKGHYFLKNIQTWIGDFEELRDIGLYESKLVCDENQPDGDSLSGTIEVGKDSLFVTSIPYDSHFTIEVDGKEVETCKVNTAFLGTEISPGKHEVVITYRAAGKMAGIALCMAGVLMFAACLYADRRFALHEERDTTVQL